MLQRHRRGPVRRPEQHRPESPEQRQLLATNQFGTRIELGYSTAILTAAYTVVNPGFNMQTPWSANPFYTDGQIQAFNRAGENTVMFGSSYVFTPSACRVLRPRSSTSAAGRGPAAGPPVLEDEWDFNLEWRPTGSRCGPVVAGPLRPGDGSTKATSAPPSTKSA